MKQLFIKNNIRKIEISDNRKTNKYLEICNFIEKSNSVSQTKTATEIKQAIEESPFAILITYIDGDKEFASEDGESGIHFKSEVEALNWINQRII